MHRSPKMHQALELLFAGHSAASTAAYNRRRFEAADDLSRRITSLSLRKGNPRELPTHPWDQKRTTQPKQARAS
jgi:hypothetical protein